MASDDRLVNILQPVQQKKLMIHLDVHDNFVISIGATFPPPEEKAGIAHFRPPN